MLAEMYLTFAGLPALTKVSCGLLNDCIVDPIMKEFEYVVGDLPGVGIQAYKRIDNNYVPYQTSRAPLPVSSTSYLCLWFVVVCTRSIDNTHR